MVKHLLKVSIWLPHLEVTFKKMWTAKSLRSAQIPLLQLKEGRLGTSMIPKAQQFWIGILNYCTVRVPRNRVKFQVSKVNDERSVIDTGMTTTTAEGTKIDAGKSPSGVCDESQHSLESTEPFATFFLRSQPSLSSPDILC